MSLSEFLLARIAEDETDASEVQSHIDRWRREAADGSQGSIVVATMLGGPVDPARVLAECEAKRRIVSEFDHLYHDEPSFARHTHPRILCALALPYADHPDYDPSWRPVQIDEIEVGVNRAL